MSDDARTAEHEPVALLLVDDDKIVRGVRLALKGSETSIVAEADNSQATRDLIRRRCDLPLVERHLPGELGVDHVRRLRARVS